MIHIALCGIPESIPVFHSVLSTYQSQSNGTYQLITFDHLEQLIKLSLYP